MGGTLGLRYVVVVRGSHFLAVDATLKSCFTLASIMGLGTLSTRGVLGWTCFGRVPICLAFEASCGLQEILHSTRLELNENPAKFLCSFPGVRSYLNDP